MFHVVARNRIRGDPLEKPMQSYLDLQSNMQLEADEIVEKLGLDSLLLGVGQPTRVGGSAMDLMVQRDIDITVSCDALNDAALDEFLKIGAVLMKKTECFMAIKF